MLDGSDQKEVCDFSYTDDWTADGSDLTIIMTVKCEVCSIVPSGLTVAVELSV